MDKAAAKLREIRRALGLTQHQVAEAVGISDGAYAMYETGERTPRDSVKVRISHFFNKPIGYIFFDEPLTAGE